MRTTSMKIWGSLARMAHYNDLELPNFDILREIRPAKETTINKEVINCLGVKYKLQQLSVGIRIRCRGEGGGDVR